MEQVNIVLLEQIDNLSIEDLQKLNNLIKKLVDDKIKKTHEDIKVGSKVSINHKRCKGYVYIIEKINRVNYVLRRLIGDDEKSKVKTTAPKSLIKPI